MKLKVKSLKKRFNRLLLCALIVCSLAVPAGIADEENAGDSAPETPAVTQAPATPVPETPVPATPVPETPVPETAAPETPEPATPVPITEEPTEVPTEAPTEVPTEAPTEVPTEAPTEVPTEAPTEVPTEPPTEVPTEAPTETPTVEPTTEPTLEPTPEPSLDPSLEPTLEPSVSPSVSPEPSATPLPLPGTIDGLVTITPEGTAQQENGVWKIQLSAPDSPLSFAWSFSGEAASYLVYSQSGQAEASFAAETSDARIDLPSANYVQGQHTLYVGAVLADGSVTWGSILFELASQQSGPPGGKFPGGFPGGRPSGGMPGGSAMGAMSQEEQGFRVTPGKALTSKHSSGTKNTDAYTRSEIINSEEAVTALALSSTRTEITLDNGAAFFVSNEDGRLHLIPESEGSKWQLNALAMNTLSQSGVSRVVFQLGGISYSLPTQMEFSGSVYASLRAKGYVSKDMEICVDDRGVRVQIAGGVYSISDSGELIPCEE